MLQRGRRAGGEDERENGTEVRVWAVQRKRD